MNDGVPVNPIIVVHDGGIYRIVDGERRYHAMMSLGTEECDVIVAEDMDEANALLAMLATDDKRQLTEQEKSQCVQQVLLLGVDPDTVATMASIDPQVARAVKKVLPKIKDEVRQYTLTEAAEIAGVSTMIRSTA